MDPKLPNSNTTPVTQSAPPQPISPAATQTMPGTVPPTQPTATLVTPAPEQEAKPKKGCCKKLAIGFSVFVIALILIGVGIVFVLPRILGATTAKDIATFDDKDVLPIRTKVADQDNAYFDLKGIGDITIDPQINADYIILNKWDDKDIASILEKNKDALVKWDSAINKSSYQDPMYLDTTIPPQFQQGSPQPNIGISKIARVNTLRGLYEIKQGADNNRPVTDGLNTIFETLAMGQKLQRSDNGLIEPLIGTTIKSMAFASLDVVVKNLKITHDRSIALNQQLDKYTYDTEGIKEGFRQEYFNKAYIMDALASGNLDKLNPPGATVSTNINYQKYFGVKLMNGYNFQPNKTKLLFANWARSEIKFAGESCDNLQDPTTQPTIIDPSTMYLKENGVGLVLYKISYTIFSNLITAKCYQTADLNATKLLVALRSYQTEKGSLPTSLDQLVPNYIPEIPKDPFDGGQMKYSATNKVVYSVGKNKKDDGGKGDARNQSSLDYIIPIKF